MKKYFPGLESMEFLTEHNAIKFFGETNLDHVYKRDGLIESFQDTPMSITSENGSVLFNLLTRYVLVLTLIFPIFLPFDYTT